MAGSVFLFVLGLEPGEHILHSDHAGGLDSFVLIGTARFSKFVTALCEFVAGFIVAALFTRYLARANKPREPTAAAAGLPGSSEPAGGGRRGSAPR